MTGSALLGHPTAARFATNRSGWPVICFRRMGFVSLGFEGSAFTILEINIEFPKHAMVGESPSGAVGFGSLDVLLVYIR